MGKTLKKQSFTEFQDGAPIGTTIITETLKSDPVNSPSHYGGKNNPLEVINIIEHYNLDFKLGNTVKYILRAGKKDDIIQELKKAQWYLNRKIDQLEHKVLEEQIVKDYNLKLDEKLVAQGIMKLAKRNFIRETSLAFYEWTSRNPDYMNVEIDIIKSYNTFLKNYPEGKNNKWFSQKRFISWLNAYSIYKKYDIAFSRKNGGKRFFSFKKQS